MLMNCRKCTTLTSDFVNTSTGAQLHQFKWIDDDSLIGDTFRVELVSIEYDKKDDVKNIHYTKGELF